MAGDKLRGINHEVFSTLRTVDSSCRRLSRDLIHFGKGNSGGSLEHILKKNEPEDQGWKKERMTYQSGKLSRI